MTGPESPCTLPSGCATEAASYLIFLQRRLTVRRVLVAPFCRGWEPRKKKLQYVKCVAPIPSSTRVSGADGIVAYVAWSQSYVEMSNTSPMLICGSRAAGTLSDKPTSPQPCRSWHSTCNFAFLRIAAEVMQQSYECNAGSADLTVADVSLEAHFMGAVRSSCTDLLTRGRVPRMVTGRICSSGADFSRLCLSKNLSEAVPAPVKAVPSRFSARLCLRQSLE